MRRLILLVLAALAIGYMLGRLNERPKSRNIVVAPQNITVTFDHTVPPGATLFRGDVLRHQGPHGTRQLMDYPQHPREPGFTILIDTDGETHSYLCRIVPRPTASN